MDSLTPNGRGDVDFSLFEDIQEKNYYQMVEEMEDPSIYVFKHKVETPERASEISAKRLSHSDVILKSIKVYIRKRENYYQ